MSKKKKLIPELRFPEFKNEDEWEYLNGNELFEPISNKNHNSDLPILAITQDQGAIPRDLIDYHVTVSEKSIESYKVVEVGDFIISLRSFQGGIEYSNYLGLCSPAYIILRKKLDLVNDFYRHYFKSFSFIQDLNKNLEGIRDGKMVSYTQFSEILIPKPDKKEQQKIADCLSSLEQLITTHSDELEALKNHKKGLMQNLFPQEGKKLPKVRFTEFEKDGEWLEDTIGNKSLLITDYVANGSFQSLRENVQVYDRKEFAFYVRLVDLRAGLGHLEQKFVDESSYEFLSKSSLHGGELLMANIGANVGEVWLMPKVNYRATLAPNMLMIKFKKTLVSDFVYHFLESGQGYKNISLAISGSGHPKINKTDLKQVKLIFPPTKTEQQKIASCLSVLDELITTQENKIEQLQQHKTGLIQGLFPKIES